MVDPVIESVIEDRIVGDDEDIFQLLQAKLDSTGCKPGDCSRTTPHPHPSIAHDLS